MDVVGELWNQRLAPLLAQLSQSCEYSDSRSLQSKSLHPHIRRVSRCHPLSCKHESDAFRPCETACSVAGATVAILRIFELRAMRFVLIFGGSQGRSPSHASMDGLWLFDPVIINIQHKWILCKRKCGFYVFFWWIVKLYLRKWVHRCIINMHLHKRCIFMQNIHWIMHKRKWRTYLWRK